MATKKTTKRAKQTKSPKKPARRTPAPSASVGTIAHTEFASADPTATKSWAAKTFGWKFMPVMRSPEGDYHMWQGTKDESGGIRANHAPETPGTLVYVEVADIQSAYANALKNGAKAMMAPEAIAGDMGHMAIVTAPGGVNVGLWAMK